MPKMTAAQRKQEAYDLLHVINSYSLLKTYARETNQPMPVAVSYRPQGDRRSMISAAWQVIRPGYETDPTGHWMNNKTKTFTVYGDKADRLIEAQQWAQEHYGVTQWAKTNRLRVGSGDWFPVEVINWLEAEIAARRTAS